MGLTPAPPSGPKPSPYSFAVLKAPRTTGGVTRTRTDLNLEAGIDALEMRVIRASEAPGPGEYKVVDGVDIKGGKFNKGNAKSGLEWELYRAAQTPGPQSYPAPNLPGPCGGRFSTGNPKSDTDWQVYRAARMPGPHDYEAIPLKNYKEAEPRHILGTKGPKTDLDHAFGIPVAKTIPGPGAYDGDQHKGPGGGKFNRGHAKSQLEWEIYRAKTMPGPADYASPAPMVAGGAWSRGLAKSGLEDAIYRASQLPGPEYDTDAVHKYLEGKAGAGPRKGARILGREGYNLPAPLNQYYAGTESQIRNTPSQSHAAVLTPWRSRRQLVKPATEASAAANGETSRKKSSNPALRAMVSELMHWADEDGDAALSLTEFCRLQQQCGRDVSGLTELRWDELCVAFGCDAGRGIDSDALYSMYSRAADTEAADDSAATDGAGEAHKSMPVSGQWAGLVADLNAVHRVSSRPTGREPGPAALTDRAARSLYRRDDYHRGGRLVDYFEATTGNRPISKHQAATERLRRCAPYGDAAVDTPVRRQSRTVVFGPSGQEKMDDELLATLPARLRAPYLTMSRQAGLSSLSAR